MQAIINGEMYEVEPAVKVIIDNLMIENARLKKENARLEEGYQKSVGVIAATDCEECKNKVYRKAYNDVMKEEGYPEKVISYTDYVGALMSSVTTIIDVITYVLIAFVAVSLVVSSIMIGIITYISVLERRKEIGILRAMGASRRNVSQVFNAETFIIGLLAGGFGIGLTLLLQIPINHVIRTLTKQEGVRAFLPPGAGGILILLCILLTLTGGFIPARKAARQDPVEALRSE
jgi:ABC-type antimicrobial peptide transport system permease subunit